MKLYAHQQELLGRNPSKHLIAFDTGTGKTLTAIELVKLNRVSVLIICPKGIRKNWLEQAELHCLSALVLTKEEFKKLWPTLDEYEAVVVDEAHYFGNYKSQLTKALLAYTKKWDTKYLWLLTATPYLSSPWNIYTYALILGHNPGWYAFQKAFFHKVRMGGRFIPMVKKGIEDKLAEMVRRIGTTAKLQDLTDVPDQVFETEYFELTQEQREYISGIEEPQYIVRWTKIHQAEQGAVKGNEYEPDTRLEALKTDRIREICEQNDKVAVVCRYNLQIEAYKAALADLKKPIYIIQGATKDRAAVYKAVEKGDKCIVLINASCSEGYELPSVPICVFASMSFSYVDYKQMIGRFLRMNRLKKNTYIHMLVKDGVDEDVYNCIMRKQDFSMSIYENRRSYRH